MKNDILFRQNYTMDSKEINQFLAQSNEKYYANHFLLDTNFVNIYVPNKFLIFFFIDLILSIYRNLALLYLDNFYLCDDKEAINGLGLMRRKTLEKLSDAIKYIDVNLLRMEKMETREQKQEYLIGLGMDFLKS